VSEQAAIAMPPAGQSVGLAWRTLALAWAAAPRLVALIGTLTLAAALAPALAVYLAKLMIDAVLLAIETGEAADRDLALGYAAGEAAVIGGLVALRRITGFYLNLLRAELGYDIGNRIFAKTARLDLETLERADIQQQITLARQNAVARPFSLVQRTFDAAQNAVTLISFAALLAAYSPWLVVLVLAGGLPLFLGELQFSGTGFRYYTGRTPHVRRRSYLEGLMVSPGAAPERLHAGASDAIAGRQRTLYRSLFTEDRAVQGRRSWGGAALIGGASVIFIAGKLYAVLQAVGGLISLGQMTLLIAALKQGQNTVTSLLAAFSGAYEDVLYASNLFALLDRPTPGGEGTLRSGPAPGDGYRVDAVSYRYPGASRDAVSDVTLHIPPGQRLGIVGANGSGKSTLVKLMAGLYQPTSGRVLLDGAPLSDWAPDALASRTALLFQPFQRYAFSARDNIAMGQGLRPVEDEAINAAINAGLARDVIDDLPSGLDTELSRQNLEGVELSGGQWQRLALARAMLRTGSDTFILDEPTSALDPEAEAALIDTVSAAGKTVVLISHRLSNLRAAQRIIVLQKGRVVESGTHADLIGAGGDYARLFQAQAGFYNSDPSGG
jgi:ATP-binding cassette, subfamily B, bacterial